MTDYKELNLTKGRDSIVQATSTLNKTAGINGRISRVVTGIADVKKELQPHRIEIENLCTENHGTSQKLLFNPQQIIFVLFTHHRCVLSNACSN
jgi:hypothetical protein